MEIKELFKIAYKKLKSSLYYDKTQSILRDEIVVFESEHANIEEYLESIAEDFVNVETREKMIENILSKISYNAFPKKLESDNSEMLKNYSKAELMIEETQYYIHLHVLGHILGVLWLLTIGYKVDKNIYRYSYGNRIRSSLYNELSEKPTYSPYLFEPYFQQYESWRDMAMDEAMHHLHLGQDVVVLTLDFRRFYYSIDITEELMQDILDEVIQEGESNEILKALNDLVFRIIQKYSSLFQEWKGRHILPIGFLPSNVLANYALKNFDQAVLDGWNPLYYGRYVDDIIIVEKVEDQSDIFKRAQKDELKAKDVIDYFLEQCSGWKGLKGIKCELGKQYALLSYDEKENCYILNKQYNPKSTDNSEIIVQDRKVKIFYFRSGESDALITCFRENIAKNKSEFRHMPEDEAVFRKDDYNEIYDLQNEETINKFRGIKSISVDKYELSKLLGKHLRIGGLITDVKETGFEKQISKIFNSRVIIENYIVWEKVIEILVINESYAFLQDYIYSIVNAIECLDHNNKLVLKNIKESMQHYLYAILCRALALVWGPDLNSFINKLFAKLIKQDSGMQQVGIRLTKMKRESYFKSRMIDKSVMPIFIDMLDFEKVIDTTQNLNLTNFAQEMLLCKNEWDSHYYFYPYLITMYDFSMIACITELNKDDRIIELDGDDHSIFDPVSMYKQQIRNYIKNNYKTEDQKSDLCPIMVKTQESIKKNIFSYIVSVGDENKEQLQLAIANVRLKHDNFEKVVKEMPNRSYQRYKDVSKLINEAIDEHADMLIMPEAFMPFEWLPTVARTCARNGLAIITGIEHIKVGGKIFNLTAIILPYNDSANKSAYISFHLKVHYAPAEKQEINGYRLNEITGNHYELYKWRGSYFPVYCCYELTSVIERALFQSYADFLVAIEWNKDVNYYSNILESLSRDIHCYCIQVNSSDYGDSRITKPSRTEEKDIVRTKGGINSTILIDIIDINKLREFQLKEYGLQVMDKSFKPTPPGFDPDIIMKKLKGIELI